MGMNGGPPVLLLALGAVVVIALFSMTIAFGVLWGEEKARNAELMASMPTTRVTVPSTATPRVTTPANSGLTTSETSPASSPAPATSETPPASSSAPTTPETPPVGSSVPTTSENTPAASSVPTTPEVTANPGSTGNPPTNIPRPGVCMSDACVEAAYSLNRVMNKRVDPCDNFYEYACGNFNRTEPIPNDKTRWGVFDVLRRQLLRDLTGSLQVSDINAHPNGSTATSTQKMQRYYHSCIDTEQIEQDSKDLSNLQNHFREYNFDLDEWPASRSPASGDKATLRQMIITARKYGNTLGVFPNYPTANITEPSQNIIEFDAGRFTLDRATLVNDSKTREHEAYVTYMTDIAMLIKERTKDDPSEDITIYRPSYEEIFRDVLQFERNLANLTLAPEDRRNISALQNHHTIEDFAAYFAIGGNALNITGDTWVDYFKTAWGEYAKDISGKTVINVVEPNYYANLTTALETGTAAPLKYVFFYNYAGWKIIEPFVTRLDDEFRAIYNRFRRAVYGTTGVTPREEVCVDLLNNQFPNAIGSLYVSNFYDRNKTSELDIMINHLDKAFETIINEADWMEPSTKAEAQTKRSKITRRLGFDDYLIDNLTQLNEEHKNFVPANVFLENYAKGRRFEVELEGMEFASRNNKTDWISGPAIVNAFYSPSRNSITFPAGILQAPFMGSNYPKYWNFAAIGTVIGHEITHGFDDRGSTRDGDGYFRNWWDPVSRENYNQRALGIINQYSNYSYMGVQLKGFNNQGENIADNGGLREAYMGYKTYQTVTLGGAEEESLPGFADKTTDQMFFLSYAQVWCGDYRLPELELQVNRPHSPGRFRVIGPLHNSYEFAAAYSCPVGSYMNPEQKYRVW